MPQSLLDLFCFMANGNWTNTKHIKEGDCGVYKITFNNEWFYIGGSGELRKRFWAWRWKIKSGGRLSENIVRIVGAIHFFEIKIVQRTNKQNVRKLEDFFIKKHFNDPKCLNVCPSAYNSAGKVDSKIDRYRTNKIYQLSLDGMVVAEHKNPTIAAENLGIPRINIRRVLSGDSKTTDGMRFVYASNITKESCEMKVYRKLSKKSVIEIYKSPLTIENLGEKYGVSTGFISDIKNGKNWSRVTKSLGSPVKTNRKNVIVDKFNINGEYITSYCSIIEAAKSCQVNKSTMKDCINRNNGSCRGFYFKRQNK